MNDSPAREFLPIPDYFVIFGTISLVLGIVAYVRRKSIISLFAGGVSGIALVAAGLLILKGERYGSEHLVIRGYWLGLLLCALLAGRFLPAVLRTKQLYPAGIMTVGAIIGVAAAIAGLLSS